MDYVSCNVHSYKRYHSAPCALHSDMAATCTLLLSTELSVPYLSKRSPVGIVGLRDQAEVSHCHLYHKIIDYDHI